MVIDTLGNACVYEGLGEGIAAALRYLQTTDVLSLAPGTYEIKGRAIYAIVDQYTTKPKEAGFLETHRRYIDVQYVVQGAEFMGYANRSSLKAGQYDESRDFQPHEGAPDFFLLREGMFAIMLPDDAHMPGIATDVPHMVKKVVVKVAIV